MSRLVVRLADGLTSWTWGDGELTIERGHEVEATGPAAEAVRAAVVAGSLVVVSGNVDANERADREFAARVEEARITAWRQALEDGLSEEEARVSASRAAHELAERLRGKNDADR